MNVRTILSFAFALALSANACRADDATTLNPPALAAAPSMAGVVDDSWSKAITLTLEHDFTNRRAASEPTKVYVAQDGTALDVAFVVTQHEAITMGQNTNGASVQSDDYVGVYIAPQGVKGINYEFMANPHGARYQTSSENSSFAPDWTAVAKTTPDGYTITMRIPFGVIRNGGSSSWNVQFVRTNVATNNLDVWAYSANANNPGDATFMGTLANVGTTAAGGKSTAVTRPQPRVQLYGLGEATSAVNGGNTTRVGADISVPITATASFVATLHPDYSNVETDQQTISPTAFERQYVEVRPFFTQASSYFNGHLSCTNCPQILYTPAIGIFSQGYAIEGTQGRFTGAAFDAIGDTQSTDASTINYTFEDPAKIIGVDYQNVSVNQDLVGTDSTTSENVGYLNQRSHLFVYANTGQNRGLGVNDPGQANYFEDGGGYVNTTTTIALSYQRVGQQFTPYDGYVMQNDIMGYEGVASKMIDFKSKSFLHDIMVSDFASRFENHYGQLALTSQNPTINFDFRDLMTVHLFAGSQASRTTDLFTGNQIPATLSNPNPNSEFLPFNGNGALLGYKIATTTPSYINYSGGQYAHGELVAWNYIATLPVAPRVHLSLETDQDKYLTTWPGEQSTDQWLERTSLDFQINKNTQLDIGARRIIGGNLLNTYEIPSYDANSAACKMNPYNAGCPVDATNLSLAFHFLAAHNEFYVVYGNSNNLSTEPALFLKWIRYIGAEKGT